MGWKNTIPTVPMTISAIQVPLFRRQAEAAWTAAHTILNAICAWESWLTVARAQYLAKKPFDAEAGDVISREGAAAIRTLCSLGARRDVFSDDGSHLFQFWPCAPSDLIDVTWYVAWDRSDPFDAVRQTIEQQLFHSQNILEPELRLFLDDLAMCPDAALTVADASEGECFVTLQQAAAMVSRSKRTLEKYKDKMPAPRVEGGGGRADEWAWSELRLWLETKFKRPLPERFPTDRAAKADRN